MTNRTCSVLLCLVVTWVLSATAVSPNHWAQWEWLTPRPQGHPLYDVAASDTAAVAVGEEGAILVSDNGLDWSIADSTAGLTLRGVAWTGEMFVAVGGYLITGLEGASEAGVVLISADGHQWTEQHVADWAMLDDVICTEEQILVVGYPAVTLTSPDGISWIEHNESETSYREIESVAWNGSLYVGVGATSYFLGSRAIYTSYDGVNWQEVDLDGIPGMGFTIVIWAHDQFLAFGGAFNTPYVLSSPDGYIWSVASSSLIDIVFDVLATSDGYVAAASRGRVLRSNDGITWQFEQVVPYPKYLFGITRLEDANLVVGDEGAIAIESNDSPNWDVRTEWEIDLESSNFIEDICAGDGVLVGVTTDGVIVRSEDGYDWEQAVDFNASFYSVRWFNGGFWVVGNGSNIVRSDDGATWHLTQLEPDATYSDIAANGSLIVAAGRRTFGPAYASTSTDGVTWNSCDIAGSDGLRIASLAWTGAEFLGVGSSGSIFRSTNGTDWDLSFVEESAEFWRVASNGSTTVAVGRDANVSQAGIIATTKNGGEIWHLTFVERTVKYVTLTGEQFVALELGGGLHTSRDGLHWSAERVPFGRSPECATAYNDSLICAGAYGGVLRAQPVRHMLDNRSTILSRPASP